MQQIYIVRHCKAEGQPPDARLTREGQEQAEELADFLIDKQIDCIISSPFVRAIQTSKPLAARINVQIQTDSRLGERVLSGYDLPDWMEHLERSFHDLDVCLPGGESSRTATQRVVSLIDELRTSRAKNIAVITHGNLMTLLMKHFDEQYSFEHWQSLTNPDVYRLSITDNQVELVRVWA